MSFADSQAVYHIIDEVVKQIGMDVKWWLKYYSIYKIVSKRHEKNAVIYGKESGLVLIP